MARVTAPIETKAECVSSSMTRNMERVMSEGSEKYSGAKSMRDVIAAVAGPRLWNDTRESWLGRAAREAKISYRACKALFYGEITDPEHKAARRVLAAAQRSGRKEAQELADRFDTIARSLNATDSNSYSADVDALLHAARALRGLAGSGTDTGG
jgi:hypothetical protein